MTQLDASGFEPAAVIRQSASTVRVCSRPSSGSSALAPDERLKPAAITRDPGSTLNFDAGIQMSGHHLDVLRSNAQSSSIEPPDATRSKVAGPASVCSSRGEDRPL